MFTIYFFMSNEKHEEKSMFLSKKKVILPEEFKRTCVLVPKIFLFCYSTEKKKKSISKRNVFSMTNKSKNHRTFQTFFIMFRAFSVCFVLPCAQLGSKVNPCTFYFIAVITLCTTQSTLHFAISTHFSFKSSK